MLLKLPVSLANAGNGALDRLHCPLARFFEEYGGPARHPSKLWVGCGTFARLYPREYFDADSWNLERAKR